MTISIAFIFCVLIWLGLLITGYGGTPNRIGGTLTLAIALVVIMTYDFPKPKRITWIAHGIILGAWLVAMGMGVGSPVPEILFLVAIGAATFVFAVLPGIAKQT